LFLGSFNAQDIDSLVNVAEQSQYDSTKTRLYSGLSEYCDIPDIPMFSELAIKHANKAISEGNSDEDVIFYKAQAYNNLAFYYHFEANYKSSIENYQTSMEIFRSIPDSTGIGLALNNLAMVYNDQGNTGKALECLDEAQLISSIIDDYHVLNTTYTNMSTINTYLGNYDIAIDNSFLGLKLQEEKGDKFGMGFSLNNLASLHFMQKDYVNAEKYMLESLNIRIELGNEGEIGVAYGNLGVMYLDIGKDSLGIDYLYRAKETRERVKDKDKLAEIYIQIGVYYLERDTPDSTKLYLTTAFELSKELNAPEIQSSVSQHLGKFYQVIGDMDKATFYGEESIRLSKSLGFPENIRNSAQTLSSIYAQNGNYKGAYEMHFLYLKMRDSLDNDSNQHQLIQHEVNAKYEKKRFADSLEHVSEKQISALELEAANAELDKTNTRNFAMGVGIFMLLVLVSIALFAYRNKRNAANEISSQKKAIENQKLVVEEKNKEITDSINYAKRIQGAILPSNEIWHGSFSESMVLYKPKDIVAGDFYWMEHIESGPVLFAAADCTGHGVPGAMVSVICNNALNRSVREHGLSDPGDILNKTREIVIQQFEKSKDEVKDGMDIALCSLKGSQLQYAGANNPLWIIRGGIILETKANKQPVGKFDNQMPYTTHTFELQKGDAIYIFSDGYVDQFGGDRGKKLKAKAFKELLLSVQDESMDKQKQVIDTKFENWKGDIEQVDDVCIIGVKV